MFGDTVDPSLALQLNMDDEEDQLMDGADNNEDDGEDVDGDDEEDIKPVLEVKGGGVVCQKEAQVKVPHTATTCKWPYTDPGGQEGPSLKQNESKQGPVVDGIEAPTATSFTKTSQPLKPKVPPVTLQGKAFPADGGKVPQMRYSGGLGLQHGKSASAREFKTPGIPPREAILQALSQKVRGQNPKIATEGSKAQCVPLKVKVERLEGEREFYQAYQPPNIGFSEVITFPFLPA